MNAVRDAVLEALYKALVEHDRAKRYARNMRLATRGRAPSVKRGTGRAALANHLTDAVMAALNEEEEHVWHPPDGHNKGRGSYE